jgi:hypothetical protein
MYVHGGSATERDDFLRALGRFVVRFSHLVHHFEMASAGFLQWTTNQSVADVFNSSVGTNIHLASQSSQEIYQLAMAKLASGLASRSINTYFDLCHHYGKSVWSELDARLVGVVEAEVFAIAKLRNRLMHDAWSVLGENTVEISDQPQPSHVASRYRVRSTGAQPTDVSTQDLNIAGDDLVRLTDVAGAIRLVQWDVEVEEGAVPTAFSSLFFYRACDRKVHRR